MYYCGALINKSRKSFLFVTGSPPSSEDVGSQPSGARDPGPHQRDRQERLHLLPRLLPGGPQEVQGGGPGHPQTKHIQSKYLLLFLLLLLLLLLLLHLLLINLYSDQCCRCCVAPSLFQINSKLRNTKSRNSFC